MTNGVRLAAAAALCLAACVPRSSNLDAAATDGPRRAEDGAFDRPVPLERPDAVVAVDLGPPCILGGTSADLPVTLDCSTAGAAHIVVSGDHVYWTTLLGPGAIVSRAPLTGGAGEALVYDDEGAVGLVVDASSMYYTQPSLGRIMRASFGRGAPTVLVDKLESPQFLASDGANLYWTGGQGNGKVMKIALTPGATPVTLIDGQARPFAIAVASGAVYWTDVADGTLLRTLDHLTGSDDAAVRVANRLASGLLLPTDLAIADGFAYVPDRAGAIRRVALEGGDLELVADGQGKPYGVATDGRSILWTTAGDAGGLFVAPLGANVTGQPIIEGQADPRFLAVTADDVYWGTWGDTPAVHRLAR